jgi:cell division protein FtsN
MMAKVSESAPDLEAVPLWEAMPIAVEAAGNSRDITAEVAAYIASRLTAKWASHGELSPAKGGVQMMVDFIPAKTTLVPFRYEKQASIESLGGSFNEAFEQFLRYLVARPMPRSDNPPPKANSMKVVAEALDREYGWFVAAEPGKADKVVASLVRADGRLARLLFNPSLYPSLGTTTPAPKASKPAASSSANEGNANPPQSAPQAQPQAPSTAAASGYAESSQHAASPSQAEIPSPQQPASAKPEAPNPPPQTASAATPAPAVAFVPPPPRSFSQKLDSAAPSAEHGEKPSTAKAVAAKDQRAAPPRAMNKASPPTPGQNYKIQVGSTRSKEGAEALAARLAKEGLSPEVEMVDLKEKGVWHRVRLQGYESRKSAEAAGTKLLEAKLISQYWIVP